MLAASEPYLVCNDSVVSLFASFEQIAADDTAHAFLPSANYVSGNVYGKFMLLSQNAYIYIKLGQKQSIVRSIFLHHYISSDC